MVRPTSSSCEGSRELWERQPRTSRSSQDKPASARSSRQEGSTRRRPAHASARTNAKARPSRFDALLEAKHGIDDHALLAAALARGVASGAVRAFAEGG